MKILFLGDSITDCDHCFTRDNLGTGYVKKLAQRPGVSAINGGTDGFTFPDVLRKWRQMYAQDTYDCVVITCGINDVSVIADLEEAGRLRTASAFLDDSMDALRTLLDELLGGPRPRQPSPECGLSGARPSGRTSAFGVPSPSDTPSSFGTASPSGDTPRTSRVLLLEPFLFPFPAARTLWLPTLEEVRGRIQKTIADFHTMDMPCVRYIPTQAALEDLASRIGYPSVTADGIHPTDAGHECLAKLVADALCL